MKKYFYVLFFCSFLFFGLSLKVNARAADLPDPRRISKAKPADHALGDEIAAREKYKQQVVAFFRDPDAIFEAWEQKNRELTPEQRRERLKIMVKARNKSS